ncbi:MAG: class I SAM-dependent methyltransferase [Proteobacteria bacterium]|nr:class I SAM-dependent methyltransferase [Pseudomonadota bacterium]
MKCDNTWECEIYGKKRHLNRYPFDSVVSFVFRNAPELGSSGDVSILEVGCGAGNNLWFAAREGFRVTGIDASVSAIEYAKNRFSREGLEGHFFVGEFSDLPFSGGAFDLVIDRAALTHTGYSTAQLAVAEIHRVLKLGGRFFFNAFGKRHTSYTRGHQGVDGVTNHIQEGTLVGVGQVCFYSRRDVERLFCSGWRLLSVQYCESIETLSPQNTIQAEWRVIAEKENGGDIF